MATEEEEAVLAAARRFYEALELMISGKGIAAMEQAWHHTAACTTAHPMGDWSRGWDEVWAAWKVIGELGRPENAGSKLREVKAFVCGDLAYTTLVFVASPGFGNVEMNCTNVFQKIGGVWKIIHHHADKQAQVAAKYDKMAEG
jgi:ketosteroid isomerase-like protein